MDETRFDRLTRALVVSVTRRQTARGGAGVALAAALGWRGVEEAAAVLPKKCKKNAQCGPGARCAGAKPGKAGKCKCKPGLYACAAQAQPLCCEQEQACLGASCGTCPAAPDPCTSSAECGFSGAPEQPICFCVTSVEGTSTCTSVFADPSQGANCTTDAGCTTFLGVDAVCVHTPCFEFGFDKVCVNKGCINLSGLAATSGAGDGGRKLRQLDLRSAT